MDAQKKVVFLIEDDESVVRSLKRNLEDRGYEVIAALTQLVAIDWFAVHRDRLDIILLDACVPGNRINTIPLLKHFRTSGYDGRVIAVSNDHDFNVALLQAGATGWCYKNEILKRWDSFWG